MDTVCKRLILLILAGLSLLGPVRALAASYQQALDDYTDQKYSQSYKKSMSLARDKRGTRRGKALMLAAAAVLELDREKKATVLFKKALDEDPELDLPDAVRSRRAQRFFADVRDGREGRRVTVVKQEPIPNAFDRLTSYLPFGLNQMSQGKYLLGLSLGGAQAFGLYYAYLKTNEAADAEVQLQAVRQTAIQTGDDINPVFLDLVDKNQDFIKRSRQQSQLSLALTALAYGGSVLEAGFNPPARSRSAALVQRTWPLFVMEYQHQPIHIDLLNPLFATQGFQLSVHF